MLENKHTGIPLEDALERIEKTKEKGFWRKYGKPIVISGSILSCICAGMLYVGNIIMDRSTATPVIPTPTPTIEVIVEQHTPTPIYESPTPTKTPIPTFTPINTPTFTPTQTPEPLDRGGIVRGQEFYIQLVDYEIRPIDESEAAAIKYTLNFVNESNATAQVAFSLEDISAVDNQGVGYSDYFVLARDYWNGMCLSLLLSRPDFSVIDQLFDIPPQSSVEVDFYLNKDTTKGDCGNFGAGTSRIDIETDYVDVRLDVVRYRTDQLYRFSGPWWRLTR